MDLKFILLLIFFNLPNCISEIFPSVINFRKLKYFAAYEVYTIFFAFLMAFIIFCVEKINSSAAKFLKYFVLTICAIIFFANIFTLEYYDVTLNRPMLEILFATNTNEASEFLLAYVLNLKFLKWVLISGLLLFALLKIQLPNFNKKFFAPIFIVILIIVGFRLVKNPVSVFEKGSPISSVAVMLPEVLENMQAYENLVTASNSQIELTKNESELPLIIFILGESTTRNHMQIYGYNLPTTPNLSERNLRGELKIFSDTVSPHSHTMPVLQELFTFLRLENENEGLEFFLSKGNFFDILNAAGYHTAWISNQEISGIYGNIGKFYSQTCQRRNFTRLRDSLEEKSAAFDEEILPLLDNELELKGDKTFCVVHLMGTHSIYSLRYPPAYEKFTSENPTRAEYDNAVLYNDFIVNEIIKRVENLDAVVIYISDHGEDVFDEKDFAGHEEISPSRFMIEIPFIIWTSPKFKELHSDVENKIIAAVDKPFMTDDMIYFLMDMLKIETADFDETLSPLSQNYNSGRQRIYGGKIYDKEAGLH